jgi:hypothetical protein
MSTRASILYHRDEERKIDIHIYEELIGDSPQDIRLEIEFNHAVINVPWPLGLTLEQVQKLAIKPDPDRIRDKIVTERFFSRSPQPSDGESLLD